MKNQKPDKPSWKATNEPTTGYTKNRPFVHWIFSMDRIFHIISSIIKPTEHILFGSDGSTIIYMLIGIHVHCKIETIISSGVETIGKKPLFLKLFAQLNGPVLMINYNPTQINLIMPYTP